MKPSTSSMLAASLLVAVGGGIFASYHVTANPFGGPSSPSFPDVVHIDTPDGGPLRVGIDDAVRLDVSATTAPGTFLAVAGDVAGTRLAVEVANTPTVSISGTPTFLLTSATLALLAGQRNCTYTPIGNPLVGGTAVSIPRVTGQTGATVIAHNFGTQVDYASCWPGVVDAGPEPNCLSDGGVGFAIHAGGAVDFDLTPTSEVKCLACVHGGNPALQTLQLAGGVSVCVP